jgi:hypothetical protein
MEAADEPQGPGRLNLEVLRDWCNVLLQWSLRRLSRSRAGVQ